MTEINIAVVGGGYWGKNIIRDMHSLRSLYAICDTNNETLNKYKKMYPDVVILSNFDDVINDQNVNAVCIVLPTELHYPIAKKALLAGKDVYVEKPFTNNVEEAVELVNLAEKNKLILHVGHIMHYHPYIIKIKEMIKSNRFGKIISITTNRYNLGQFRTTYNSLFDLAPHDISVILSLCDNKLPNCVLCNGIAHITKNIHDITNSILKYDDKYININVNWINPYKEQKMTIVCEHGMIIFDDTSSDKKLVYYDNYCSYSKNVPVAINSESHIISLETADSPLKIQCAEFIKSCKSRISSITDGHEGIRVMKVLSALQESLHTGNKTHIPKNNYWAHETAIIDEGAIIGDGTKIWHFSHVCKDAKIGKNCNIGQNVFIGDNAVLGDYCKVQNNVSIYNGVTAEDYVFFGPSCVLTNDYSPSCENPTWNCRKTKIEHGASLGANCTIVCGNTIGKKSLIGAGAVVTKDVEPYSVIVGNPGKILKSNIPTHTSLSDNVTIGVIGLGVVGEALLRSLNTLKSDKVTLMGYDKYKTTFHNEIQKYIGTLDNCLKCDVLFTALPSKYCNVTRSYDNTSTYEICKYLSANNFKGVILIKSTFEPTTTMKLEKKYPDLQFIHNPEFLRARFAYEDNLDQKYGIVLGLGDNTTLESYNLVNTMYSVLWKNRQIYKCKSTESELLKILSNSYYAIQIQFFTEIYLYSKKIGINYDTIMHILKISGLISVNATNVPGPDGNISYGGLCHPKDTNALLQCLLNVDTPHSVLESCINERNTMRDDNDNVI